MSPVGELARARRGDGDAATFELARDDAIARGEDGSRLLAVTAAVVSLTPLLVAAAPGKALPL